MAAGKDLALLVIRIASALAFLFHGCAILFGAFGGPGPAGFAGFTHTSLTIAYLVGLAQFCGGLAMLTGILEIAAAIKLRKVVTNEWLLVLAGIASVAFGVLLMLQPAAGALVLVWWVGAYALVLGILLFVLALRMRRLGQRPFAAA